MADGLSMVYSYFDPDMEDRSLGTFMILDHIERARAAGLPHVYLGYWVDGSPKMAYKVRFGPRSISAPGAGNVSNGETLIAPPASSGGRKRRAGELQPVTRRGLADRVHMLRDPQIAFRDLQKETLEATGRHHDQQPAGPTAGDPKAVRHAARHHNRVARPARDQLAIEEELEPSVDDMDDLVGVVVDMDRRPLARRNLRFEHTRRSARRLASERDRILQPIHRTVPVAFAGEIRRYVHGDCPPVEGSDNLPIRRMDARFSASRREIER
jgi:hypothetical protein